jgi:G2/mitotic-specific cyclin 3/4
VHYSGYTLGQLKTLVTMIFECCQLPQRHHSAVYDKFSSPKYKRASLYVEGEIQKGFTLSFPMLSLNNLAATLPAALSAESSHLDYSSVGILVPAEG